ncbi:hypothetical protein BH11BAC5_BH11BAC5_01890 [soil metagenome]
MHLSFWWSLKNNFHPNRTDVIHTSLTVSAFDIKKMAGC